MRTYFRLLSFTPKLLPIYLMAVLGRGINFFFLHYILALALADIMNGVLKKDWSLIVGMLRSSSLRLIIIFLIAEPLFTFLYEWYVKKNTGSIRKALFAHIQRLPAAKMESQHSGDLLSRMSNDVLTAENAYGDNTKNLFCFLAGGVGAIIIILYTEWRLGLIAIGCSILNTLVFAIFSKPIKSLSEWIQQALSECTQRVSDIMAGRYIIKVFNLYHSIEEKYRGHNRDVWRWSMKRVKLNSFMSALGMIFGWGSFAGVMAAGALMVMQGRGVSFVKIIFIAQLSSPVIMMFSMIGNFITQLRASLAGAERVFEILDMPAETLSYPSPVLKSSETKNLQEDPVILIKEAIFEYEKDEKIINRVNCNIYKNQLVAIVGSSGGGKSTLLKLLMGFYPLQSGEIQVFGRPLDQYEPEQLRGLMAYVPQDSYLFSTTIRENIAYGKPRAIEEEIIQAAKAAYAHDFIIKLDKGYDTIVGERGALISGGQRQRIAIARALLKNAPILLLDEATSALDSESESQVQKALEVLMENRTTIVIAHRLSTIQEADVILVLSDGCIIEQGKHTSLLEMQGEYARLFKMQFS